MKRQLPQVKHNETYGPLLLIARNPQLSAWLASADRAGLSLMAWAVDRLDQAADREVG